MLTVSPPTLRLCLDNLASEHDISVIQWQDSITTIVKGEMQVGFFSLRISTILPLPIATNYLRLFAEQSEHCFRYLQESETKDGHYFQCY